MVGYHSHTVGPYVRFMTANDGTILWPTPANASLLPCILVLVFSNPLARARHPMFAIEADSELGPVTCGDWCTVLHLQAASCRAWDQLAYGLTAM
jgi:hypothetical protein